MKSEDLIKQQTSLDNNATVEILIQQRSSLHHDRFNRPFADYVNGFTNDQGDLWYGLEPLHKLTSANKTQYQLVLSAKREDNGKWMVVVLDNFYVDSGVGYNLRFGSIVAKLNTVIDDSELIFHKDKPFSARDRDQDSWRGGNCAFAYKGGWWFGGCGFVCLNCDQAPRTSANLWGQWTVAHGKVRLTETKMSIRIKM